MSRIRQARLRLGVSGRELARRAGVSPMTVVDWERSDERDAVSVTTLRRAADALGGELFIEIRLPQAEHAMRREQRRLLEYHRQVAAKLVLDPETVIRFAARRLDELRERTSGDVLRGYIDDWSVLLGLGDPAALVRVMLDPSEEAHDRRQVSPFYDALTDEDRRIAIARAAA